MLSQQSKYALRAVLFLNEQPESKFLRVEEIAEKTDMPAPYLAKILKSLAQRKIILSRRGKNGGVRLNRENKKISFMDICESVEDPIVQSECVLFKKPCNQLSPCAFHRNWSVTKSQLLEFLCETQVRAKC